MTLTRTIAPTTEPIVMSDVASHLRVGATESAAETWLLNNLIVTARMEAEEFTGRAMITQTYLMTLDDWSKNKIKLPVLPVQSITSITYKDTAGATQTLASNQYQLAGPEKSILVPAFDVTWPDLRADVDAVKITFVAGYADADAVPAPIKTWCLMKIAALYENREGAVTGAPITVSPFVDMLILPYKIYRV